MITEVPVRDGRLLRDWYDTMRAAWTDGRADAVYLPFDAARRVYLDPPAHLHHVYLAALDGERVVGGADVMLETEANLDRAEIEIAVAADRRREGIGAALFEEVEGRCRAVGRVNHGSELYCGADEVPEESAGHRFATRRGYAEASREHHLVLDLPVPDDHVDGLRGSVAGLQAYDVVTWTDRCPDDLVDAFCRMRERMAADVPMGEVVYEFRPWTRERLRTGEERSSTSWTTVTAAARHRGTGVLAGYSELLIPKGQPGMLWQDDTLVMPEHRGHRLGLALKLATYDVLRTDHLDRTSVHTWTEVDNRAMLRTNERFGFRRAETMLELQRLG